MERASRGLQRDCPRQGGAHKRNKSSYNRQLTKRKKKKKKRQILPSTEHSALQSTWDIKPHTPYPKKNQGFGGCTVEEEALKQLVPRCPKH